MKKRYKIPIIAISALLGISFIPLIASNIYCDYLADSCTSRITGVGPGGVYLPAEWGTRENCYVANDDGTMKPCLIDIAQINWPFPPRISEHESNCDEVCPDDYISTDQKNDVPSGFSDGITEIINSEHESLKYRNTPQVIGDTYLSKNVQQWQNAWQFELETEYQNYGDDFYTELGRLLMKNEMQHQMNNLGIVNADDDYEVFSGGMLTSLPPHIGFSAVIYATDGNYYRLEGGTLANQVRYYRTTQLQFPDITEELSMESILDKPQLITIISEDGNKARQEPSTLVIHVDDNTVEFFNNTPDVIRVQDSGSGRMGEENTLGWMGPTILPYQKTAVTFDEPGLIEWDARKAPSLEDPLWWQTHAGGYIVVLSDHIDDFSRDDKARIAQKILHNSDIPIIASGAGNAEKVLKVSLDPAVTETVPNAEEYYLQRAHQLIPFNVEIIVDE